MIDTTTRRFTPASSPSCWRLRAAVVKNSVAASRSGEGPVAASTTDSTPASASARPSPVITSTPVARDIGTASWPPASSASTTCLPTLPVAPATATLMSGSFRLSRETNGSGGSGHLGQPLLEEAPLGLVVHQLEGAAVRQARLVDATEPPQQLRARGMQVVVAVELEPVHQVQGGLHVARLGHRRRLVELHDR